MKAIKITDEFSQLRHKHYLNHGNLNGSYAELFGAIVRPQERYSDLVDTSSISAGASEPLALASAMETMLLPEDSRAVDVSHRPGMQLFQTMFYGDPMYSGFGSGGGLGTLLREVGNVLSADPSEIEVITLVGRDTSEEHRNVQPREYAGPRHLIRRLSYAGRGQNNAFSSDEATLRVLLSEAIKSEREISKLPAVLHTRYIDGATYAAADAALINKCALVCTLTPDPHRSICDANGEFIPRSAAEAAILLYRIKIGDELVRRADALVGIGRTAVEQQLLPYFPQLEQIRGPRLVGIDEGVQFIDTVPSNIDPWKIIDAAMAGTSTGRGEIVSERRQLPVILSVGRLHPAKAQPALLQAWIETDLYRHYNLVLVGGDLRTPNPTEIKILEELDMILATAPAEARTGYLHVGALTNNQVRLLEAAFAQQSAQGAAKGNTNVYVCPSPKEEFGLSILEAMAAGLPVFAPLRGGAPSYISHGSNGLLIDTSSTVALTNELGKLLHPNSQVPPKLLQMAAAGRETVRKRYSLQGPAAELAAVYEAALKHKHTEPNEW